MRDRTTATFDWLPVRVRRIVATTARFIQQQRSDFYFARAKGRTKLWIFCGRIIPLSITRDQVWVSLPQAPASVQLERALSWSWDRDSEHQQYTRTPSRNGYYCPSKDPSGSEWEKTIAPAFFDYLHVLCKEGHCPDHRTASTPGLCEQIASWGGHESETASFTHAVRIACRDSSEDRRERLRQARRKPPVVATVINIIQRNPDVVAEVLFRAAGCCEVCRSQAPFQRASDGSPYLEVHHKVRLADGGDDTVENAVAVCPNCHRQAHFG
jgi:5-methylcytosine-specific restriction endonuclease McrA